MCCQKAEPRHRGWSYVYTLSDWVAMEMRVPFKVYTTRIAIQGWGGAIELATCAHRYGRQVHVLEKDPQGEEAYICITQFGVT